MSRKIVASIVGEPVETFVLADDDVNQLFLLQDHIQAMIDILSNIWNFVPDSYKRKLAPALTSLTVLFLVVSCATGGERPTQPTVIPPVAALTEPEPASGGEQPLPDPAEVGQENIVPAPVPEQSEPVVVAPTTTSGETPTPLGAHEDISLTAVQGQAKEQGAPVVEQSQSWTVLTQEDLLTRMADPDSRIREQAKYVFGADKLNDQDFAEQLGGRMVEMTTDVDGKPRTNMVVGVVEGKTDLSQVHAAITAAREQGLEMLGSTLFYVTHDETGMMRIWHTETFEAKGPSSFISTSYQGMRTFMGFFTLNTEDGRVTDYNLGEDNYLLLGMGTREDFANSRVGGPAVFEYRVQINPNGSSTVLTVGQLGKAFEFKNDPTSPKGYTWKSYATPDMRENGAAEIIPSLDKINVVISELDTTTAQSAEPNWHEADLLDYQGSKYLEIRDTRQDRVAYLVYVEVDETTGERKYGPVILLNSGNFDPNSTIQTVLDHQPLTNLQLALDTISSIGRSNLFGVMQDNNILLICAKINLPDHYASSHKNPDQVFSSINTIHFHLKTLADADPEFRRRTVARLVIGEIFEILGHMYFTQGVRPPSDGHFFILMPQANHLLVESDAKAFLYNAALNVISWFGSGQHDFNISDSAEISRQQAGALKFFQSLLDQN